MRLDGRVAIVTGGGGAIGGATARRLADLGAAIVVADLDLDAAETVAHEIVGAGGRAEATRTDVTVETDVEDMVATAVRAFGGLDALHNNAGGTSRELAGSDTHAETMTTDLWDATMAVNLRGPMLGVKHAVPHLRARGGGAIVNTSSVSAMLGDVLYTAYGAAKAGVDTFTRSTATRYGRDGIRCNAVSPGLVLTPTARMHLDPERLAVYERHHPLGLGEPDDIAGAVAWLVSDDARFVTGQVIAIDGGLSCHMPTVGDFVERGWSFEGQ